MLKPYFENDLVTLYHGDSLEFLSSLSDEEVDCVITDPPYTERTHLKARANTPDGIREGISFSAFTEEKLEQALEQCGRVTKGWVIANLDYNHAFTYESTPPKGLKQMRIGVWVKNNPMPQITGDRPAQGWEAISYLHRTDRRSAWNGGGLAGNYVSNLAAPTGHPTPKPLSMISSFVERFTQLNDVILDPFAGGGTTLLAARNLGRKAIGIELEEKYCELIANRLSQEAFDFGGL